MGIDIVKPGSVQCGAPGLTCHGTPGKTVTTTLLTKLNEVEFPVFLNYIVKPGFDTKKLVDHEYSNVYSYFSALDENIYFLHLPIMQVSKLYRIMITKESVTKLDE